MKIMMCSLASTVAVVGAISGCAPSAAPPTTVTVTATPTTALPVPPPAPVPEPEPVTTDVPVAPAANVKVPNGVGKSYQQAQDLWREAGLIVMPGTDATGQGRLMVLDSNWVVLSQTPKAGKTVTDGSEIRARVKKYTD